MKARRLLESLMRTATRSWMLQCAAWALFAVLASAWAAQTTVPATDSPTLAYIESVKAKNVRYSGKTVLVSLDDGDRLRVTKFNGPDPYGVVGPLAGEYDILERVASTRGEVALALSEGLRACQRAPASQEDIDNEMAMIPDVAPFPGGMSREAQKKLVLRVRTHLLNLCKGVTAEQTARADFWLAKAAELGDPYAALNYAEQLGNSLDAVPFWESAWLAGHADALASLARLYREGRSTPPLRDPDHAQAYAYQYLYVRLTEAMSPTDAPMGRIRARWLAEAQADLQAFERGLTVGEQENAVAQARAMLEANANCCQPL